MIAQHGQGVIPNLNIQQKEFSGFRSRDDMPKYYILLDLDLSEDLF